MPGLFDNLNEKSATQGGKYLVGDANYQVMIYACKDFLPRNGGRALIHELEVTAIHGVMRRNVAPSDVGFRGSWYVDVMKDAAGGNIATFLRHAMRAMVFQKYNGQVLDTSKEAGFDVDALQPSRAKPGEPGYIGGPVYGEQNVLGGVILDVNVVQTRTRAGAACPKCLESERAGDGVACAVHSFSRHDWSFPVKILPRVESAPSMSGSAARGGGMVIPENDIPF